MNQIDRKPYMIHADTPCRILSEEELQKMYPHCTTTSEALGELTRAELKTACLHALRRAMREVLPQVALELDLEEGKEQFAYEYEGVPFRVTVERSHWDVMLCTEVAFDVEDYIEWLKGQQRETEA